MGWCDVMNGGQTWSDYISTQDQIKGFEAALETHRARNNSILALNVACSDAETVLSAGLGALTGSLGDVGHGINADLRSLRTTVEVGLDAISSGLEALNADFNLVMGDVVWQLELQNASLVSILNVLQAPLDTQARELRRRAEDAYSNGWYEEALADFHEAERKNYQDFSIHRSIGFIYLYHLFDVPRAHEYFVKAGKYARPRSKVQAAEAEYFAGIASAILQQHSNAIKHMDSALLLNDRLFDAAYLKSTLCATCHDLRSATTSLQMAMGGDARYASRAAIDPAFDGVRQTIDAFLDEALETARCHCVQAIETLLPPDQEIWGACRVTMQELASAGAKWSAIVGSAKTYAEVASVNRQIQESTLVEQARNESKEAEQYRSYYLNGNWGLNAILPGFAAAGVRLGESIEVVKALHGEPEKISNYEDDSLGPFWCFYRRGFDIRLTRDGRVASIFLFADKASGHTAFRGATPEGLGVGSRRKDFERAYGPAIKTIGDLFATYRAGRSGRISVNFRQVDKDDTSFPVQHIVISR